MCILGSVLLIAVGMVAIDLIQAGDDRLYACTHAHAHAHAARAHTRTRGPWSREGAGEGGKGQESE